ncbi:MAG: hypothetical protein ACM31N_00195 [Deltaproteobacteria bacterium]
MPLDLRGRQALWVLSARKDLSDLLALRVRMAHKECRDRKVLSDLLGPLEQPALKDRPAWPDRLDQMAPWDPLDLPGRKD